MLPPAAPALTTVRGFMSTPASHMSDNEDITLTNTNHDYSRTSSLTPHRGRASRLDDVVSVNCSPVLRPQGSPAVSGITKLRQLEPLSLNIDSRTSTMSTRARSQSRFGGLRRTISQQSGLYRSEDEFSENGSLSYEIPLEHDFISESVQEDKTKQDLAQRGQESPCRIQADDFEPLRCLGKGAYGTVLLVKQRTTGRLFAQKQFKKASVVVHKKLVEQTKTERQILESVNRHPFVVKLFYAFQDHAKLYLILEYGEGGELFTHLNTEKMFSESVAAFYMAEMVLALSHLHKNLGVVYRDLKPENCLLDSQGHLLLTDFGLSKVSAEDDDSGCKSILGTVEYMAPEVVLGKKYGKAVDWWSLGALGYDLMTGNPPFRGGNHAKIQHNITKQKLVLPYFLSSDAKDLFTRLLRKEPAKRLGTKMPKDLQTIKQHRFFRKIDWTKLAARELEPPIRPLITDPELAENFAPEFTDLALSPVITTSALARGGDPWELDSGTDMGDEGVDGLKDDPFGGFSFVASSSLLENGGYLSMRA